VADRQALLEDEARAARESDGEDEGGGERRSGRRHRGGRSRHRSQSRNDETIRSEPVNGEALAGDDAAREPGEVAADEHATAESQPGDQYAYGWHESDADGESASQPPVGEAANPPVPAEIGTPVENPQPEFAAEAQIDSPAEAAGRDQAAHHAEDVHHV